MNLFRVLKQDGFHFDRKAVTSGGEYAGLCPFCGGTDRFRVWPESGRYWCRQCGKKGDAIQYLRDFRNLSFQDACHYLNITPTFRVMSLLERKQKPTWIPRTTELPVSSWQEKAAAFLTWSHKKIPQKVITWLHGRGLTDETIKAFGLGWNPKDFYRDRQAWGLESKQDKKLWIPKGLVIPYIINEKIIRLRIRRPDEDIRDKKDSRYILISGSDTRALVFPCSEDGKIWLIVESELDALLVHQEAGDLVGVIAMGNAQTRPDNITHNVLSKAERILVALDGDPAGAKEFWHWWKKHYKQAKRWPTAKGKDPTEMHQDGEFTVKDWVFAGLPEKQECRIIPFPSEWKEKYDETTLERLAIMTVDGGLSSEEAEKNIFTRKKDEFSDTIKKAIFTPKKRQASIEKLL